MSRPSSHTGSLPLRLGLSIRRRTSPVLRSRELPANGAIGVGGNGPTA